MFYYTHLGSWLALRMADMSGRLHCDLAPSTMPHLTDHPPIFITHWTGLGQAGKLSPDFNYYIISTLYHYLLRMHTHSYASKQTQKHAGGCVLGRLGRGSPCAPWSVFSPGWTEVSRPRGMCPFLLSGVVKGSILRWVSFPLGVSIWDLCWSPRYGADSSSVYLCALLDH